jgi:ankyrin repeat protein
VAARLLKRHPEVARADLFTAVACGEVDEVGRLLRANPDAAKAAGGPRRWPPLLYLCAARLPENRGVGLQPDRDPRDESAWSGHAVAVATLLLDHGADPNVYYEGGNADIHYTALACVVGRGEEQAAQHPRARELAALLLERGAEPYDMQLFYNAFGWHAAHRMLRDDPLLWLLDLVHHHSLQRGRAADWRDPEWKMLSMGGYGCGAWYLLYSALRGNYLELADWVLSHGAAASPPRAADPRMPPGTLYEQAVRDGQHEFAALLARHGAAPSGALQLSVREQFVAACFKLDRIAAEALVRRDPRLIEDPAPLLKAAERNRADVAALLLDLGMPADLEDPQNGARALHLAAYNEAEAVIRLLIDRGAEIDPRDATYHNTPIGWAQFGRRQRALDLLAPHTRDIFVLTSTGRVDRLADVLEGTARPPAGGDADDSLLFYLPDDDGAAVEAVRLLLAKGMDPAIRRPDGSTAAQVARARGLEAAAALLTEAASSGGSRA